MTGIRSLHACVKEGRTLPRSICCLAALPGSAPSACRCHCCTAWAHGVCQCSTASEVLVCSGWRVGIEGRCHRRLLRPAYGRHASWSIEESTNAWVDALHCGRLPNGTVHDRGTGTSIDMIHVCPIVYPCSLSIFPSLFHVSIPADGTAPGPWPQDDPVY